MMWVWRINLNCLESEYCLSSQRNVCHASVLLHGYLHKRHTALYARYPAVNPQTKAMAGYRGQAAVRRLCRSPKCAGMTGMFIHPSLMIHRFDIQ
jgi:hypothetical protein